MVLASKQNKYDKVSDEFNRSKSDCENPVFINPR